MHARARVIVEIYRASETVHNERASCILAPSRFNASCRRRTCERVRCARQRVRCDCDQRHVRSSFFASERDEHSAMTAADSASCDGDAVRANRSNLVQLGLNVRQQRVRRGAPRDRAGDTTVEAEIERAACDVVVERECLHFVRSIDRIASDREDLSLLRVFGHDCAHGESDHTHEQRGESESVH